MDRSIKRVIIENFQGYIRSEFDFTRGINLIIGTSESGKSSLLRAINFALHNYPKGDEFIHKGKSEASITIEFFDGAYCKRIRSKVRNAIIYCYPKNKEVICEDIGTKLPTEYIEFLGNPPYDQYHGYLDYIDQFSNLFLIGLKPTELPRCISELLKIDDLENTITTLSQNLRFNNKIIKSNAEKINLLEQEIKDANNFISKNSLKNTENYIFKYDELEAFIKKAKEYKEEYFAINNQIEVNQKFNSDILCDINNNIFKAKKLIDQIKFCKLKKKNILILNDSINKINKVNIATKIKPNIQYSNKILNKFKYIEKYKLSIEALKDEFINKKNILSENTKLINKHHNNKNDILNYLKTNNLICPECNQLKING